LDAWCIWSGTLEISGFSKFNQKHFHKKLAGAGVWGVYDLSMKFTRGTEAKGWDGLKYWVYSTKDDFAGASAVYFEVTGSHGLTKTPVSDRVYYVMAGHGEFIMGGETVPVGPTDVVVVPKNTEYDYWAASGETLKLFLVHAPAFDGEAEIKLDR
jgi:mannose-6-phosphate isomerase-like protein (cupin superfamily)